MNTWKINDWKSDKKTGILNKDLWMLLDGLQKKLEVAWRWLEGQSTSEGNNRADTLAGGFCSEKFPPPLGTWDGLRYYFVALPEPSI